MFIRTPIPVIGRAVAALCVISCLVFTTAANAEYRLGVSDRVRIKIQEWPDLTGEYAVSSEGTISLPLIGEVTAQGLQIRELSELISDLLQKRTNGAQRPYAVVDISQFRPFFILGNVQKPGDYPYRPGLTVLQAIGVAGGYYRPVDPVALRLEKDAAVARGELKSLASRLTILTARAARLTAAISGKEIAFPAELTDQKNNPIIAAILDSERTTLTLERSAAKNQNEDLESLKQLYLQEISSLRDQQKALKDEQVTLKRQLDDLRALSTKGLALAPSILSMERSLSQNGNELLTIETSIVRAQESIKVAEQRARDQALERSRSNTRDLQQVKDDIIDTRTRIVTQRSLLEESQSITPSHVYSESTTMGNIVIVRMKGSEKHEIVVDESALVEPNDVIRVPSPVYRFDALTGSESVLQAAGQVAE
jgi:polysaccharide biosynthesis/export protein ExoF